MRRDAASEWLAVCSAALPLQSELLAPCARWGRRGPGGSGGLASRGAAPTRPSGRGRLPAAAHLQAWGIVGTHSTRKPPRHRNNSIPRPTGQHCPSRRCIDITCNNAPKPGPEDTLWKTSGRDGSETLTRSSRIRAAADYRRLRAGHHSTMADSVAGTGAERCEPARSYRGHGTTVGQCPTGFPIT